MKKDEKEALYFILGLFSPLLIILFIASNCSSIKKEQQKDYCINFKYHTKVKHYGFYSTAKSILILKRTGYDYVEVLINGDSEVFKTEILCEELERVNQ